MICKICGVNETVIPDDICNKCKKKIEEGKITKCVDCGEWKNNKLPRCYECWQKFDLNNTRTVLLEKNKERVNKTLITSDDDTYKGMNEEVKEVADFLSDLNLSWLHEPAVRLMDDKFQTREWHPSFFLYQFGVYLEVCTEGRIEECNYKKDIFKLNNISLIIAETFKNDEDWKGHIIRYLISIEKYRLGILLGNLYDKIPIESTLDDSLIKSIKNKKIEVEIKEDEYEEILKEIKEKSTKSIYYKKAEPDLHEKYPRAYHMWTKKEDTLLFTLYNNKKSIKELSIMFERQPNAIKSRLKKIERIIYGDDKSNILFKNDKYPNQGKSWTRERDQILKKEWLGGLSNREIGIMLGRSVSSIRSRAKKLKLYELLDKEKDN